ncbi:L-serine ammonia-lyase, iron-sulfur-dependent, subunit alpha [Mycobacterium sp. AMU20-3851]|uniref:L-serine ammonia-lyase, iron-sulfur-dependent, subunit alpha n=1 Tax=Mycobacterium sp. AMU20-3851 TaxID=3122055 RepID=UPI003754BC20
MQSLGSIFNHALGPVTYGPSSSNTAGTNRIGYACRQIFGGQPSRVVIEFSQSGAFPATYRGMKSDVAFTDGLNGHLYDRDVLQDPSRQIHESAFPVSFAIVPDVFSPCIEAARFRIFDDVGREVTILADSVGGGDIRIHRIDGQSISVNGLYPEALVLLKELSSGARADLTTALGMIGSLSVVAEADGSVVQVRAPHGFSSALRGQLEGLVREHDPQAAVRYLEAVYPVAAVNESLFDNMVGTSAYCAEHGVSLGEAAIRYEQHVSGRSREEVEAYALKLLSLMRSAVQLGLETDDPIDGVVGRHASTFLETARNRMDLGFLTLGMAYAQAVMEHSNTGKVIVCAPTGGATGILPATLVGYADQYQVSDADLVKPLMAAGLLGILMTRFGNTFNGTDLGCQVEVGCAAAMSAAALTELLDGLPAQAFNAAAIAMQCNMGIVCDPVGGLVQAPCIQRNANGVGTATTSALMAVTGFDPVIPFDESFEAAVQLGKDFPPSMKGSSCAGLCGTPTAQRITLQLSAPKT